MIQPTFISLPQWAASLIIDYPDSNIPLLINEENWKQWGNSLIQENIFSENNAPSTANYNHWRAWAYDLFFTSTNNQ